MQILSLRKLLHMYNLSMKFPFLLTIIILSLNIFSDEVNDPFEDFNRKTFEFNEKLDEKLSLIHI